MSGEKPAVSASAPGSVIDRTKAEIRPSSPRSSRSSSTTARYSRSSVASASVDGDAVGVLFDLDAQLAGGVGLCGAGDAAVQAAQGHRSGPAGQANPLGDLGDGAHTRELAVVARNEQHALLVVADVDRQRDVHGREDHGVVGGYKKKCRHQRVAFSAYDV